MFWTILYERINAAQFFYKIRRSVCMPLKWNRDTVATFDVHDDSESPAMKFDGHVQRSQALAARVSLEPTRQDQVSHSFSEAFRNL
jgi:hypothetical protein